MGTGAPRHDVRLGRRIALKFIDPDRYAAPNADAQQQLMHEARAASGLNHPNICQVTTSAARAANRGSPWNTSKANRSPRICRRAAG